MEDDALISEHLSDIVEAQGFNVPAICSNEEDALYAIEDMPPDYAFLDIRLLGDDLGINIGRVLKKKNIPFMYLTSFSDKKTVQEAVDTEPIGYILKPFETDEIVTALEKFRQIQPDEVVIKSGVDRLKIKLNDILYIKSDNVYLEIYSTDSKYLIRSKMTNFLEECQVSYLVQVHRSYTVNIQRITKVKSSSVFINSEEIPVSKNFVSQTESLL